MSDIVTDLRSVSCFYCAGGLEERAANEIDRLRAEVAALKSENATLKKQRGDLCYEVNKLEDEILGSSLPTRDGAMSDNNTNDITVTEEIRELADFLRVFADANDGGEFEAEQCEKLRKAADALLVLDAAVTTLTKENAEQHGIHPWCDNSRLHEEEEKSDSDPLTGIQYGDLT